MRGTSRVTKLMTIILAVTCFLAAFGSAKNSQAKSKYKFEAKEIYVMDAKSGQMLYQKDGNQKRPIASLSKLMTLYLTKKAIDQHQISWNQKVPVSKSLIKMSKSYALGSFKIKKSKQYTVKQLYQAALIASSNSAAIALGELVANGNNTKFIDMMNRQAKKWQLDAHFVSSSGLDNTDLSKYGLQVPGTGKKAQNMVSAKAISTVAAKVLGEFPAITKWSSKPSMKIDGQVLVNSNRLLKGDVYYKKSEHVDGLKTGFTETAGLCLTVSFWHKGRHLIATIIDSNTIFSSMERLVRSIEKNYTTVTYPLQKQNFKIDGHQVTALPQDNQAIVWKTKTAKPTIHEQYTAVNQKLPIEQGTTVGNALLRVGNGTAKVPMLAAKTISAPKKQTKKTTPHRSLLSKIGNFLGGIISGLVRVINNAFKHL
ncbi:D-alanyl-D-alanine carboxypeptidase family protein [Lentilactobacillus farraginis]|uniref:S11 family D-Ala-D-Ala carboxypeptidase n=1 Tax=Lentilactobacillus farraginis DSM 18382 = JCM 14108 TaxID=1423743 RepID=A0A0R1V5I3_9LACO|nr:serine hydrolase [Lentilactobacillus farraginis]KRM00856.1 S11 family D-Ala-D-Ala carboxypeptidase [Lentilactobacillus farraginis DSM 18382 = JCM 14108]